MPRQGAVGLPHPLTCRRLLSTKARRLTDASGTVRQRASCGAPMDPSCAHHGACLRPRPRATPTHHQIQRHPLPWSRLGPPGPAGQTARGGTLRRPHGPGSKTARRNARSGRGRNACVKDAPLGQALEPVPAGRRPAGRHTREAGLGDHGKGRLVQRQLQQRRQAGQRGGQRLGRAREQRRALGQRCGWGAGGRAATTRGVGVRWWPRRAARHEVPWGRVGGAARTPVMSRPRCPESGSHSGQVPIPAPASHAPFMSLPRCTGSSAASTSARLRTSPGANVSCEHGRASRSTVRQASLQLTSEERPARRRRSRLSRLAVLRGCQPALARVRVRAAQARGSGARDGARTSMVCRRATACAAACSRPSTSATSRTLPSSRSCARTAKAQHTC